MKAAFATLALLLASRAPIFAQSTILWDESVNGPISNLGSDPTPFGSLTLGTNSVLGSSAIQPDGNNWTVFEDIFTFSVPAGSTVTGLILNVDRPRFGAWVGNPSFSSQIGYTGAAVSGELLTQWQLASLGAGPYGMYVGNYDTQPFTSVAYYRLDFFVQNVPEPGAAVLGVLGGLALTGVRRARSTSRR